MKLAFSCMGRFLSNVRTSWITLPHYLFGELISVIVTPLITPNNFGGFHKRNLQQKLHLLFLPLLGRITPPITPKYSQRISRRNSFHLGYTRKFWGINCVIPMVMPKSCPALLSKVSCLMFYLEVTKHPLRSKLTRDPLF